MQAKLTIHSAWARDGESKLWDVQKPVDGRSSSDELPGAPLLDFHCKHLKDYGTAQTDEREPHGDRRCDGGNDSELGDTFDGPQLGDLYAE